MLTLREFYSELERRRATGASQAHLAAELCVSQPAVQQWLTGATTPSKMVRTLAAFAWRAPRDVGSGLPDGDGQEPAG